MIDGRIKLQGVILDVPPADVGEGAWSVAHNVRFIDNGAERVRGAETLYASASSPPTGTGRFLLSAREGLNQYLIMLTETGVFACNGSLWSNITPAHYATDNPDWDTAVVTGGLLNGVPFFNVTGMRPFYWDLNPGQVCQLLPGWDDNWRCRALRAHRYFLIALGMTEAGVDLTMKLRWSASADPGNIPGEWVPSATNDAGDDILADTEGDIVDGLTLRDEFIVYKRRSAYRMAYTGGILVFASRQAFGNAGVTGPNQVAEHEGRHYVWTGRDIVMHDGQQIRSIGYNRVRRTMSQLQDVEQVNRAQVLAVPELNEVWVALPELGKLDQQTIYIYNTVLDTWSTRDAYGTKYLHRGPIPSQGFDDTWDGAADAGDPWDTWDVIWDLSNFDANLRVVVGAPSDQALPILFEATNTDYGGKVVSDTLRREQYRLPDGTRLKYVGELWPELAVPAGGQIDIRVGGSQDYADGTVWGPFHTFTVNSPRDDDMIPTDVLGRFISLELRQRRPDNPYRLESMRLRWQDQGRYG